MECEEVCSNRLKLRAVKINETVDLNDSLTSFRPLQAQVLFLGDCHLRPVSGVKRQSRHNWLPAEVQPTTSWKGATLKAS